MKIHNHLIIVLLSVCLLQPCIAQAEASHSVTNLKLRMMHLLGTKDSKKRKYAIIVSSIAGASGVVLGTAAVIWATCFRKSASTQTQPANPTTSPNVPAAEPNVSSNVSAKETGKNKKEKKGKQAKKEKKAKPAKRTNNDAPSSKPESPDIAGAPITGTINTQNTQPSTSNSVPSIVVTPPPAIRSSQDNNRLSEERRRSSDEESVTSNDSQVDRSDLTNSTRGEKALNALKNSKLGRTKLGKKFTNWAGKKVGKNKGNNSLNNSRIEDEDSE